MSIEEGREPVDQDIEMVKNDIERCIKRYMNKKETINTLNVNGKIEPWITQLVWERLEEGNPEFFKAYYVKLKVKDQIMEFNRLLSEQVELMNQNVLSEIIPSLTSNRSHVLSRQHILAPIAVQSPTPVKTEDMQQLHVIQDYGSSIPSSVQQTFDLPPNMFLSQNQNVGLAQTMNGHIVRTPGYAGRLPLNLNPHGNFVESHHLVDDASLPAFGILESTNDFLLDLVPPSLLQQQYQQTSFNPDFAADISSDLLEAYKPTDARNFVNPHGDLKQLDPASANLRYPFFSS